MSVRARVIIGAGCVVFLVVLWAFMIGPFPPERRTPTPAPVAPTTPAPTATTTADLPDVDAPGRDNDGESRFCRRRWWC